MGKVLTLRATRPSGWNRERWTWMKAVVASPDLNSTAKLIAVVLAQTYANNESAECYPGLDKLMATTATPKRTVMKALADLAATEWVVVLGKSARDRPVAYAFRWPLRATKRLQNPAVERVQVSASTGAELRFPPAPLYKDKPDLNHTLPRCPTAEFPIGSITTDRWDDWLRAHGFSILQQIGMKTRDGIRYVMPVSTAPDRSDGSAFDIALKWAEGLRMRAEE